MNAPYLVRFRSALCINSTCASANWTWPLNSVPVENKLSG